eukprot:scaffold5696_cov119-Isochrysis_galbana.AAC.17
MARKLSSWALTSDLMFAARWKGIGKAAKRDRGKSRAITFGMASPLEVGRAEEADDVVFSGHTLGGQAGHVPVGGKERGGKGTRVQLTDLARACPPPGGGGGKCLPAARQGVRRGGACVQPCVRDPSTNGGHGATTTRAQALHSGLPNPGQRANRGAHGSLCLRFVAQRGTGTLRGVHRMSAQPDVRTAPAAPGLDRIHCLDSHPSPGQWSTACSISGVAPRVSRCMPYPWASAWASARPCACSHDVRQVNHVARLRVRFSNVLLHRGKRLGRDARRHVDVVLEDQHVAVLLSLQSLLRLFQNRNMRAVAPTDAILVVLCKLTHLHQVAQTHLVEGRPYTIQPRVAAISIWACDHVRRVQETPVNFRIGSCRAAARSMTMPVVLMQRRPQYRPPGAQKRCRRQCACEHGPHVGAAPSRD